MDQVLRYHVVPVVLTALVEDVVQALPGKDGVGKVCARVFLWN